jgi:hypothetical protein
MRFNADQIHADLDPGGTGIQFDDGQTRVTLHPADAAALTELRDLTGILLDQLDPTREEHAAAVWMRAWFHDVLDDEPNPDGAA